MLVCKARLHHVFVFIQVNRCSITHDLKRGKAFLFPFSPQIRCHQQRGRKCCSVWSRRVLSPCSSPFEFSGLISTIHFPPLSISICPWARSDISLCSPLCHLIPHSPLLQFVVLSGPLWLTPSHSTSALSYHFLLLMSTSLYFTSQLISDLCRPCLYRCSTC